MNQPTPEHENFAFDLAMRDVHAAARYLDLVTSDEYIKPSSAHTTYTELHTCRRRSNKRK